MKIVLISTDQSNSGIGVRTLASHLRICGFQTSILLCPLLSGEWVRFPWKEFERFCQGADLVGISCMTHGVEGAIAISKRLRGNRNAKVVIGGIHASMAPETLMNEFDLICHGEGEDVVVELAKRIAEGRSLEDIPGLWVRKEGEWVCNRSLPLRKTLDEYPLPDYDITHQFIVEHGHIVPMEPRHVTHDFFVVLGSRGCPHHCAYCSTKGIREKFPWRAKVRHYSIDRLLLDMKTVLRSFPEVRSFWIDDDTFFAKPVSEIKVFSEKYKNEIGRPFQILISPWTFSEEKLRLLVDCGLERLIMGVQSGSDRTNNELYDRRLSADRLRNVALILHSYTDRMKLYFDFIGMNPFEKSGDLLETIRFIRDLPPPFFIYNNNLAFYPGTAMLERARQEKVDLSFRTQHSDPMIGFRILRSGRMKHSLLHLILLRMQEGVSENWVGKIPRRWLGEDWLRLLMWMGTKLPRFTRALAIGSAFLLPEIDNLLLIRGYLNWRVLLKRILGDRTVGMIRDMIRKPHSI